MAGSWLFECFDSSTFEMLEENASGDTSAATTTGATETTPNDDDEDRAYRKKSREKMRRYEVNEKFDELIDLLGLSNRIRKSVILHETVLAIKALRRDHDELRSERDRLQNEASHLASCLHAGSGMTQIPGDYIPLATHQSMFLDVTAYPLLQEPYSTGGSYFPISPRFPVAASSAGKPTTRPIAPESMEPLRETKLPLRK